MLCKRCEKEIQEKIKQYNYFVGTSDGAKDFIELDKQGKTDLDYTAGTKRVFMYVFGEYLKE